MFVSCLHMLSCVRRGLCDGLITRPEECYSVSNCVWLINLNTEEDKAQKSAVVSLEEKSSLLRGSGCHMSPDSKWWYCFQTVQFYISC
jgi:hypothetical protein